MIKITILLEMINNVLLDTFVLFRSCNKVLRREENC